MQKACAVFARLGYKIFVAAYVRAVLYAHMHRGVPSRKRRAYHRCHRALAVTARDGDDGAVRFGQLAEVCGALDNGYAQLFCAHELGIGRGNGVGVHHEIAPLDIARVVPAKRVVRARNGMSARGGGTGKRAHGHARNAYKVNFHITKVCLPLSAGACTHGEKRQNSRLLPFIGKKILKYY